MTDDPAHEKFWKTCLHESGHAYGFYTMLGPLGVVSVRPGAVHSGVTIGDMQLHLRLDGHPLDGMDPIERRAADRWLVMSLMGEEAETLELLSPFDGRPPLDVPADTPASLSAPMAAALATAEANTSTGRDREDYRAALDLATDLVGRATASYYLRWIQAEAREATRMHIAPVHALASALWREPIIDGRKAAAIFEAAHERSNP